MSLDDIILSENRPDKDQYDMILRHEVPQVVRLIDTGRMVVARDSGRGTKKGKCPFHKMKRVLKVAALYEVLYLLNYNIPDTRKTVHVMLSAVYLNKNIFLVLVLCVLFRMLHFSRNEGTVVLMEPTF